MSTIFLIGTYENFKLRLKTSLFIGLTLGFTAMPANAFDADIWDPSDNVSESDLVSIDLSDDQNSGSISTFGELNPEIIWEKLTKILPDYKLARLKLIKENNKFLGLDGKAYIGMLIGLSSALMFGYWGPHELIHEVLGHIYTGLYAINIDPRRDENISFQSDSLDNLNAITQAGNVGEFFKLVGRWMTHYDYNQDGRSAYVSYASLDTFENTPFGKSMSADERRAWVAISGSLPMILSNGILSAVGVKIRNQSPTLSAFLISFSVANMLFNLEYAASPLGYDFSTYTATGDDFITFAKEISEHTGEPAEMIARSTFAALTLWLPLITSFSFVDDYARPENAVPDALAVKSWLGKIHPQTMQTNWLNEWSTWDDEQKRAINDAVLAIDHDEESPKDQEEHQKNLKSLKKIYKKTLRDSSQKVSYAKLMQVKENLYHDWKASPKLPKVEQAIKFGRYLGVAGILTYTPLLILSQTQMESLNDPVKLLSYLIPVFALPFCLDSFYQCYQNLATKQDAINLKIKGLALSESLTAAVFLAGSMAYLTNQISQEKIALAAPTLACWWSLKILKNLAEMSQYEGGLAKAL